jgi:nitrogen regulatory protein P-II 1
MWSALASRFGSAIAQYFIESINLYNYWAQSRAARQSGQLARLVLGRVQPPLSAVGRIARRTSRKGTDVKLIIAAIKPFKLEEVREALTTIGVRGMMVTEIKGFGSQSGHTEIYRGAEYAVNFVPKVKLEIVVSDALADQVVDTIQKTARTDKIGDGKIFVLDVAQAVRVRTGETNDDAL